jgi:ribosomal protein L22
VAKSETPAWEDDATEAASAPAMTPTAKPSSQKAEDILAMIRSRKTN